MLESAEGEKIGESKIAARQGIAMVVLSRVGMATPGMVSTLKGASTPFSRPTRDPGWEFSLGGDFFPPFKL